MSRRDESFACRELHDRIRHGSRNYPDVATGRLHGLVVMSLCPECFCEMTKEMHTQSCAWEHRENAAIERAWTTKDSGHRLVHPSGMQRDTTEGKTDYLLLRDGPMYERWAQLLMRGAAKYDKRNWMKACSEAELDRARESAARHFEQWLRGDIDEDHAAAVVFNINEAEYIKERLK